MTFQIEEISPTRRKLQIEVPVDRVAAEFERAFREFSRRARIPGFRPGRAPRGVIERHFGDDIRNEVITSLVREEFSAALEDSKLEIVSQPELDVGNLDASEPLRFSATVEILPPLADVDLQGISVSRPRVAIGDEEVDKVLEQLRLRDAQLVPIEGRSEVARGDFATIQISVTDQGAPLPALDVESGTVEVAGGRLPQAIDERLAIARVGETFTVEAPAPEGASPDLAGKELSYTVTVKSIAERSLPALDDEFAKDHGDCETLDELCRRIRSQLEQEAHRRADAVAREGVIDELVRRSPIEVPESFVSRRVEGLLAEFKLELQSRGLQLSSRDHEAEARDKLRPRAEREVRRDLLLDVVARQLGIEVGDDELAEQIGKIVASGGKHAEHLREHYAHDHARDAVRSEMRRARTLERLLASADVTEVEPRTTDPAPE